VQSIGGTERFKIAGGLALRVFGKLRFDRQSANLTDVAADARNGGEALVADGQARGAAATRWQEHAGQGIAGFGQPA